MNPEQFNTYRKNFLNLNFTELKQLNDTIPYKTHSIPAKKSPPNK